MALSRPWKSLLKASAVTQTTCCARLKLPSTFATILAKFARPSGKKAKKHWLRLWTWLARSKFFCHRKTDWKEACPQASILRKPRLCRGFCVVVSAKPAILPPVMLRASDIVYCWNGAWGIRAAVVAGVHNGDALWVLRQSRLTSG